MKDYLRNIGYNIKMIFTKKSTFIIELGKPPKNPPDNVIYMDKKSWEKLVDWAVMKNMTVEQAFQEALLNGIKNHRMRE